MLIKRWEQLLEVSNDTFTIVSASEKLIRIGSTDPEDKSEIILPLTILKKSQVITILDSCGFVVEFDEEILLSLDEYLFVRSINCAPTTEIRRGVQNVDLWFGIGLYNVRLKNQMFPFIGNEQQWTIEELLKLKLNMEGLEIE